jgi:hypothetical protein
VDTSSKEPLKEIVRHLLGCKEKQSIKLERGLYLAFTPQPCDDLPGAGCRFVWSRKKVYPSDKENEIVERIVRSCIDDVESLLLVDGPMVRTGLCLVDGWRSSLMTWRWTESTQLKLKMF